MCDLHLKFTQKYKSEESEKPFRHLFGHAKLENIIN